MGIESFFEDTGTNGHSKIQKHKSKAKVKKQSNKKFNTIKYSIRKSKHSSDELFDI